MASEVATTRYPRVLMRELRAFLWNKKFDVPGTDLYLAAEAASSANYQLELCDRTGKAVGYFGAAHESDDELYLCGDKAPVKLLWKEKIHGVRDVKDILRVLITIAQRHEHLLVQSSAEASEDWHETVARNGVALALVVCPSTKRWLMHLRSGNVVHPRTWGLPGGAIENGEFPQQATTRELAEEAGVYNAKYVDTIDLEEKLHLVLFRVDKELRTKRSDEVLKSAWVDAFPEPLIPVMRPVLAKYEAAITRLLDTAPAVRSLADFSPKFRAWFGKSVTIGADGLPQRFYHGTAYDFDTFNRKYLGRGNDQHGVGFYFSTSPDAASGYTDKKDYVDAPAGAPNVHPVYLRITKPVTHKPLTQAQVAQLVTGGDEEALWNWGDVGHEGRSAVVRTAVSAYLDMEHTPRMLMSIANDMYKGDEAKFVDVLTKATGYDGMLVHIGDSTLAVAFHPNQIKSVFNKNPTLTSEKVTGSVDEDAEHKLIRCHGVSFSIIRRGPESSIHAVAQQNNQPVWASFNFDGAVVRAVAVTGDASTRAVTSTGTAADDNFQAIAEAASVELNKIEPGAGVVEAAASGSACVDYVKKNPGACLETVVAGVTVKVSAVESDVHVQASSSTGTLTSKFKLVAGKDAVRAESFDLVLNDGVRPYVDVVAAADNFPALVNALVNISVARIRHAPVRAAAEPEPAFTETLAILADRIDRLTLKTLNGFKLRHMGKTTSNSYWFTLSEPIGQNDLVFTFGFGINDAEIWVQLTSVHLTVLGTSVQRRDIINIKPVGSVETLAKTVLAKALKLAVLAKTDMNIAVKDGCMVGTALTGPDYFGYLVAEHGDKSVMIDGFNARPTYRPSAVAVEKDNVTHYIGFSKEYRDLVPFLGHVHGAVVERERDGDLDFDLAVPARNRPTIMEELTKAAVAYVRRHVLHEAQAAAEPQTQHKYVDVFSSDIFPIMFKHGGHAYRIERVVLRSKPLLHVFKDGEKHFKFAVTEKSGWPDTFVISTNIDSDSDSGMHQDIDFRRFTSSTMGHDIRALAAAETLRAIKTFDSLEVLAAAEHGIETYDLKEAIFTVNLKNDFEFTAAGHKITIQSGLIRTVYRLLVDGVNQFVFMATDRLIDGKRYAISRVEGRDMVGGVHRFNVTTTSSNPQRLVEQVFKKILESRTWQERLQWKP